MLTQLALEQSFHRTFTEAQDNWKASCPFHDEQTPSFLVHKTELIANCFGCGISGHIDTLLANYKGISVKEARRLLDIQVDEQLKHKLSKEEIVYKPRYIPESWLAPWRKEIHPYVTSRGLEIRTLSQTGTRYDSVSKRQVFPHRDRHGRLLGAVGRTCTEAQPKWYFYWGYDKGSNLYSPFYDRKSFREFSNGLVVVEGVFDCLKLQEQGIHAAATLGTKVTNRQIEQLRDYKKVIIAFDNDQSGREATERVYHKLKRTTEIEFVKWPDYAKDVMDIQGDLNEWVGDSINYVSRELISLTNKGS